MNKAGVPAIALLAGNAGKRQRLASVLAGFGYQVVFAGDPEQLDAERMQAVQTDAWLLELAEESPLADWLLEHSPVPVLLGAGEIPLADSEDYPRWQRRLLGKLLPLLGEASAVDKLAPVVIPQLRHDAPPCVWVLGASLGGPAAVKRFLDLLPADLPVAFIYAQHIDAGFEQQLPQILGRQNDWRIINCQPGAHLRRGDVLVAPVSRSLRFGNDGVVQLSDEPWPGLYRPSIEAVLDETLRAFGAASGAIIFSGMGEDGVAACGRLRQQGIEVWTQDEQSAACAVMPKAVQDAGYSHRQGSPEELAAALQQWLLQEWPLAL
ncbi:MAG: chemotaxis protein CheB [Halopseudomonas sp.]|uniref:chemotaxis protein CheB n=1 Tax=Halopseudomonas sp. TaxID=2901191 RepID=UPI003002CE6B